MTHAPSNAVAGAADPTAGMRGVTVVVRAAGERTAEQCRRLLERQVSADQLVAIAERPFTQAVRRTFEIGLEHGRPWTLAIDADVLLRDGAVADLVALGEAADPATFEVQGLVLDKLFGTHRGAGNHLFRTELIPLALGLIPPEGRSRRPETFMLNRMRERGHGWRQASTVVGLHDFEQYFRDVYRKSFVHARKHRSRARFFERFWAEKARAGDTDFEVALWGLRAGAAYQGPLQLDVNRFPSDLTPLLGMRGWSEKHTLAPDAYAPNRVAALLQEGANDPILARSRHLLDLADRIAVAASWPRRAKAAVVTLGWARGGPWITGRGLERLGQRLQDWAER